MGVFGEEGGGNLLGRFLRAVGVQAENEEERKAREKGEKRKRNVRRAQALSEEERKKKLKKEAQTVVKARTEAIAAGVDPSKVRLDPSVIRASRGLPPRSPKTITRPGGSQVRAAIPRPTAARATAPERLRGAPAVRGPDLPGVGGGRRPRLPSKRDTALGVLGIAGPLIAAGRARDRGTAPIVPAGLGGSASRSAAEAAERERRRGRGQRGRRSTILTGPLGVTRRATVGVKSLLGA